jgi:hypothetical protein
MSTRRANILFEGPPDGSKYCEGCQLWEETRKENHCPIFGDVYEETEGETTRGLHCRPDECSGNEDLVRRGIATAAPGFQKWVRSPYRDVRSW